MQTVSELYRTLAASKTTRKETRVLIDCSPVTDDVLRDSDGSAVLDSNAEEINATAVFPSQRAFTEEDLYEVTISGTLFSTATLSFGGCVSREITVRFYPRGATIPRMAAMRPQVRLVGEAGVSEWVSKGVFYIDTRQYDRASGILTLTGYDAMLKAEADFISPGDVGVWPQRMADVADEIAEMLGLEMDARTRLDNSYWMELPTGYTMREILGYIAAAHAGNWTITDEGKLRLVRIDDLADTVSLGRKTLDLTLAVPFDAITHVIVNCNEELYVEAGGGNGRTLEVSCPWGTWEMAQAILASLNGFIYQPFSANGAIVDPAAELGDNLTVDGTTAILAEQTIRFNSLFSSDIVSPGEDELDHEYPYHSTSQREIKRRLKDINTSFRVETDRISAEISAVDGRVTRVQADIAGVSTHVEAVEEAAVSAVAVYYALSTSESIAPSSGWSTTAPGWENGKYMWQKTVTTYGDGTTSESSPTCISGARGASQEPGYSTAIVYLYKRSATVVSAIDWQNDLVYHFPTQRLLTVPTGWSETIPAGNNPLYVTAATAYANDGSDVISASEWTSPVLLVKNGEDGADGAGIASVTVTYGISSVQDVQPSEWSSTMPSAVAGTYLWTRTVTTFEDPQISPVTTYIQTRQGSDGTSGVNGLNSATVYLYHRFDYSAWYGSTLDSTGDEVLDSNGDPISTSEIEAPPSIDWSETLIYNFSTKKLTSVPEGWTDVVPDGYDPIYITAATASSRTNTADIPYTDWSSPVLFFRNGRDGIDGAPGQDGADGRPGRDGSNGTSSYIHIKYSAFPNPTDGQMTDQPSEYIGICVTETSADPTTASWYTWSKWEGHDGAQGIPGTNGRDGTSEYVHFAYSTSADGVQNFSVTSFDGAKYLGICHDDTVDDPLTPASYEWSLIKGADGTNGRDGVGVTSIVPEYYLSTSVTTQTGGEWTTTCPAWVSGKFIWTRSHVYWEDGTETTTTPVLDNAVNGLGQKHTEVKQMADKIEWLVVGDSATTFTLTERAATLVSDTIDLTGYVTFTSLRTAGSTIINGSNITTGTIDASVVNITHLNASNISSGTMSADKISGGTINGTYVTIKNLDASEIKSGSLSASRISGGTLDCSLITVSNLSASVITSGTLSADRISGGTINADNITVKNLSASSMTKGTLDGSKVTVDNLNASNLKSGTLNASTVPVTNMNASNLTSGSINAQNIPVTNINASNITTGTLSANRISGGTINGNNVTITNLNASNITSGTLSADRIDTNSIKVKTVYGSGAITDVALVYTQNNKLYLGYAPSGSGAVGTFETYMDAYNVYFQYGTHAGFTLYVGASGNTLEPSFAPTGEYSAGYGSIGLANRQFKAVYTKKVYIDGAEINSTILNTIYADGSSSYKITLNSSKAFIPASSTGYYLGNSSYPFERLYLGTNCYLSASSNKLAVNGTVIGAGIEATDVKEIYCASSASNKIALSSAKDFVPSGTGFSLGSSSYPFDELYVGTGSSYYWKLTASALLPSQTVAASGSYFDIGSSTKPVNKVYANEVYIGGSKVEALTNMSGSEVKMGGSTSYYIVASTSRELRPSNSGTTYPFYLGSSSYYWHYAYIGSNTAMIGSSGTSTGSKIGFYGTTAVVRQTLSLTSNNMSYTSVTASNYLYALNNLIGILKNKLGLIA